MQEARDLVKERSQQFQLLVETVSGAWSVTRAGVVGTTEHIVDVRALSAWSSWAGVAWSGFVQLTWGSHMPFATCCNKHDAQTMSPRMQKKK